MKSLRNLQLSDNSIKNVKELAHLEKLEFLSVLDFCFNPIQQRRFYRFQVFLKIFFDMTIFKGFIQFATIESLRWNGDLG